MAALLAAALAPEAAKDAVLRAGEPLFVEFAASAGLAFTHFRELALTWPPVRSNVTGMRATLTVSLPGKSKQLIKRAARESGLTTSEYVRLAIFRRLWQDATQESRRVAVPRARAKGIFTDDEVFRLIS
jgi:hypothetical protein